MPTRRASRPGTATSTHDRHAQRADPVRVGGLAEHRPRQHVPEQHPAEAASQRGHARLPGVGGHDLAGVKPMLFRMPIRRYPATTAPLTTFVTISTDMTRPMTPKATRNGTNGAMFPRLLRLDGQVGLRAGHRAGGQRAANRGDVGAERRRAARVRGTGTASARWRASRARQQRGDLAGHHPAARRAGDRVGDADHGQPRLARRAGHRQLACPATGTPSCGPESLLQHDLAGPGPSGRTAG